MARARFSRRWAALGALASVFALGVGPGPLDPEPGMPRYQVLTNLSLRGGVVNAAGGNLLIKRSFLALNSLLGLRTIELVYNSADETWRFGFDASLDGAVFTDASGARFDLSGLSAGDPIDGTQWILDGPDRIRTQGGLLHAFGADGRLQRIEFDRGSSPTLEFEGDGRTETIRQCNPLGLRDGVLPCDLLYSIAYDANDRVVAIMGRAGRVAEFEYVQGRLAVTRGAKETSEALPGTTYEYEGSGGRIAAIVSSEGERIELTWDGAGRLVELREIDPAPASPDPTHTFVYGGEGPAGVFSTVYTDPRGHATRLEYDAERRLLSAENLGTGDEIVHTWEGRRLATVLEAGGALTRWTWQDGRVAAATDPAGNVTTFTYASHGVNDTDPNEPPVARIVDDLGLVEERLYYTHFFGTGEWTPVGRLRSIENGAGEIARFSYVSPGLAAGIPASSRGLLRRVLRPDGTAVKLSHHGWDGSATRVGVGGNHEVREFDAVGNRLRGSASLAPVRPGLVARTFDAGRNVAGLVLAGTLEDGGMGGTDVVSLSHRSDGRLTSILRPDAADHAFDYDGLGRLVRRRERVDGVWQDTLFEYDLAGNHTATELPNGMRREWTHDAANRVQTHTLLRNGGVEGSATYTWQDGRLVSVSDSLRGETETFAYDAAGRLAATFYGGGESLHRSYDVRSRLIGETWVWPGVATEVLSRSYDGANREISLARSGVLLLQRTYADGRLLETRYANGLLRTYAYDPDSGRLTGAVTSDEGSGEPVETTAMEERWVTGASPHLEVSAETETHRGVQATTREDYHLGTYDLAGGPEAGRRVYAWSDGSAPRAYAYDALGNQRDADAAGSGNARAFQYNAEGNRLLSADLETPAGTASYTYAYDAAGFAVERNGEALTWDANGRVTSYGAHTFLWDTRGRPVSWLVDGVSRDWSRFGGRVEAAGVGAKLDLGEVSIRFGSGDLLFRHFDFRGNVKFTSDGDGDVAQHYRYDPYGVDAVFGVGEDTASFVGRLRVADLMLLGARVYDPAVGRFLSQDPRFANVNAYAYTRGNPLWFSDPDGRHATAETLRADIESAQADFENAQMLFAASVVALTLTPNPGGVVWTAVTAMVMMQRGFALGDAIQARDAYSGARHVAPTPSPALPPAPAGAGSEGEDNPEADTGQTLTKAGGGYSYGGSGPGGRGVNGPRPRGESSGGGGQPPLGGSFVTPPGGSAGGCGLVGLEVFPVLCWLFAARRRSAFHRRPEGFR